MEITSKPSPWKSSASPLDEVESRVTREKRPELLYGRAAWPEKSAPNVAAYIKNKPLLPYMFF
jgi:hypothetical protein